MPRLAAPAASTPTSSTSASSRKPGEHPDRVRAAADAGDHGVRQPTLGLEHLSARLAADHRLQLPDDCRVGSRADARADQVMSRLDVRDPVADRLARRLLERLRAELDRTHLCAEQAHPLDVRGLPAHVLRAHVDDALEPETGADGRGRDSVLSRTGLRDDPVLAETAREDGLSEGVVQLVRAGVEEVLPLEIEPLLRGKALRAGQRCRPSCVVAGELVELGAVARVGECLLPGRGQLVEPGDQRLRDVAAAVGAVGGHARAART